MPSNAQLKLAVDALEALDQVRAGGGSSEAWWRRLALAAEGIAGAATEANASRLGWMRRAALAVEIITGTTGAEETTSYAGYLKRLVDALEDGVVGSGSLANRLVIAAEAFDGGAPVAAPELWLAWGDSLGVGIDARDPLVDLDWPAVKQIRFRAPAGISADISPLDQAVNPTGTDYLSPYEYFAKGRAAQIGADVYLVAHNSNGTSFGAVGWGVGNTLHEAFIARANAAIQTFLTANPTGVVGGIIDFECSNDANAGAAPLTYLAARLAAMADMRARIFQNGVSGANIAAKPYIINGMLPEYLSTANRVLYEQALRSAAQQTTNCYFYKMPEGIHRGDNLHPSLAGSRSVGAGDAALLVDVTAPVVTGVVASGDYSCYEGQKMLLELSANKYAFWTLAGAGAGDYEIIWLSDGVSGINLSRMRQYLRWAGDGTGTVGAHPVTLVAEDASRTTPHITASLTCPVNGRIVGGGNIAGIGAGTAGQTTLQNSGNNWTAYRTTDGSLGHAGTNNGFSWLGAAAFAKA